MAICSLLRIVPVAVVFAFLNSQPLIAATEPNRSATHRGKHFVLGFTAQIESLFYSGLNEISIYAFYDTYVNITLHKLRSARLRNKFIKAGDVLKYEMPTRMRMRSTMVDTKGILVTSTADVAVSCLSQVQFTSDSYLALPTARLGRKYVVASYAKTTLGIISTEDNTVVRIILNTNGILRYGRNLYRRGKKLVLKLNKLETFHIDHNADLSGTIIEANKAIAVLSGDKCAKVITQYCDHLIEFLLPVQTWGTEFVVATTGLMNKNSGDIYRVFAYENNTRVRSKDGYRLLQSGQFTEYDLGDELASFFNCSKPCQVVQYIKGYVRAQGKEVDSSLLIVPSIDHFLNTYNVYLSGTKKNGFQHSVTLLTKSSETEGLQVNGRNTASLQWQNIEGTKFSWTILQISTKSTISHRSRSALFGALVFGEADYRSHGYPGGLNAFISRSVTAAWSRWSEWSECTFSCNTGTQMRTRTCTGTNLILNDNRRCPGRDSETRECATWKCRASCLPLKKMPANGYANSGSRSHGSSIQFGCNDGYKLIGSSSINCYDGKWSEDPPKCIAFCREISYIMNGQVLGGGSLKGEEKSFTCDQDYVLVGEKTLRCTSSGNWNASEPKCKVEASWSRWGGWTDCSVSCDNGIQTRQRTCIGTNLVLGDNTLCLGRSLESRACASWKCPDCSKICTTGKLNNACDACICDDNILNGVVKDNTGILLGNATIALAEFPFKILGRTSVSGKFALRGFCISEDNIIVNREGYLPQTFRTTKINPTTAVVTAILKKIVFPEITANPESKLRLEGQPMTLCCEGTSSTTAKFEWTINDRGADEYQHDQLQSSKLIIPHVFKNMSGEIKCRVYDDHGAEFSDPAMITVFNGTDDTCDPTPSQQIIALAQGCTEEETNSASIDVGECAETKCIGRHVKNMNDCKEHFCCQPIATKNIKVVCLWYSFDMESVTRCGCGDCPVKQTVVKGVARGGPDNKPFKYGYIYHGDKYLTRTGRKGDFSFKVPGDFSRFAVTFRDKRNYNNFQELTKVIPLVPGRKTFIEVRMKPRPEPIKVDAKMGFEISMGNSQNVQGSRGGPAVAFAVPPQGLLTEDGDIYNGTAKVEVNFVDPRNATEVEEADGDFTTVDEDGEEQQLETFGVIKMDFKDENDKRLQPKGEINILLDIDEYNITENEVENIKLWYLDEKSGRWRIMDTGWKKHQTHRSKRSHRTDRSAIRLYSANINGNLYSRFKLNLDKLSRSTYLKVKVADATRQIESVLITVLVTRGDTSLANRGGSRYEFRSYNVKPNKAHCIRTFWTEEHAIIRALANSEYLFPKETGLNDEVIRKHSITYSNSSDFLDRFFTVKMLTAPLGNTPSPFYGSMASCKGGPEEYSFTFETPVRDKGKKDKEVTRIGNNLYEYIGPRNIK